MDAIAASSSRPVSALRQVWADPLYRGATIAMFLSGLGTSAAAPQVVLFLVSDLGLSLSAAGLFYLTSLAAPVAGYLVGSRSDRTGGRLGLFRLCAVAGFLGWAGIAVSTLAWVPFVIGALVLVFSGSAASQLFAAIHDRLARNGTTANESVVAIVRMALTAGWVVGPVLGAWAAADIGLRAMLWITAFCALAQILPLGAMTDAPVSKPKAAAAGDPASARPGIGALAPLLAFTGLYVLVYAGEPIKYGYLLLYMKQTLGLDPATQGAIIGIQPLVELMIMPFSVVLGRRFGMIGLMSVAALCGVAANICFALWGSAVGLFMAQTLMGGVWGIFMVLGIIVAQRLLPGAVATASAILMNSMAVGSAFGGVIGSVGVAMVGLPHVFLVPAALALLASLGLAAMSRSGLPKPQEKPVVGAPA